nr:dihydropteroate synthase [Kribbella aluminosa]
MHEFTAPALWAERPRLVGIVNVAADSFSDGGRFLATEDALAQAWRLLDAGADIIELGAAASHPGAERVSVEEEKRRLADVLDELVAARVPVSVDSFTPQTQLFAAAHGATYLNDIQGFPDPEQYAELPDSGCSHIVVHSVQRRGPATKVRIDAPTVRQGLEQFFRDRLAALQAAGINRERLVVDPGLGYFLSSAPEPSVMVLGGLDEIRARFGLTVEEVVSSRSHRQRPRRHRAGHPRSRVVRGRSRRGLHPHPRRCCDFGRAHDLYGAGQGTVIAESAQLVGRKPWAARLTPV